MHGPSLSKSKMKLTCRVRATKGISSKSDIGEIMLEGKLQYITSKETNMTRNTKFDQRLDAATIAATGNVRKINL